MARIRGTLGVLMSDPLAPPPYQPPPPLPPEWSSAPPSYRPPPPPPPAPAPRGGGIPPVLKTVLSMLFSMLVLSFYMGWPFAVGFTLLILVHEIGHLVAAWRYGLQVSAPVFIPFLGAFIQLKQEPPNAWVEAVVGIGGPLFGTAASAVPYLIYVRTGEPYFAGIAYYGFMLNLFNLAPVGTLDGGRIVTAVSTWLWIPGYAILLGLVGVQWMQARDFNRFLNSNFLILAMLVLGLPRLFSLFRARTEREQRYYAIPGSQRWLMGSLYFGLIALLYLGMRSIRADM